MQDITGGGNSICRSSYNIKDNFLVTFGRTEVSDFWRDQAARVFQPNSQIEAGEAVRPPLIYAPICAWGHYGCFVWLCLAATHACEDHKRAEQTQQNQPTVVTVAGGYTSSATSTTTAATGSS